MIQTPPPPRSDSSRPVVGITVVVFVAILGIAAWKSSRDLAAARQRERLLETRIEDTNGRIEELRGRIERLRSDPGTLERLAREDLGMVRPGDVVIELPSGAAPAPAPPAPAVPPPAPAPAVPVAIPATPAIPAGASAAAPPASSPSALP